MKNKYFYLTTVITITINFLLVVALEAQDVGIGTASPDYRLHVCGTGGSLLKVDNTTVLNMNVSSDFYFKTGAYYTAGIKTIGTTSNAARLGLFTYAAASTGAMLERMSILDNGFVGIGINTPGFLLDVNGRMRIRNGGGSAGLYLSNAANNSNPAFIGMYDDTHVGFYGAGGAGWNLLMNTTNGRVSIGSTSPSYMFEVHSDDGTAGLFENSSGSFLSYGVSAYSNEVSGSGIGVRGEGGNVGVWGVSGGNGGGNRAGLVGLGTDGGDSNYGVKATARYGSTAIGVYGEATDGATNWGGYFVGSVYSTGTYQGSDRKLKNDIKPIADAMHIINNLKPAAYTYKTKEYEQMQLPEGLQYGLIADEVKQVMPAAVKKSIQPATYENNDINGGRKLQDAIEFDAVNYTAMIPVLISAMQEQQAMIEEQLKKIAALEQRLSSFDD